MDIKRYTAKLYFNGQVIGKSLSNDLQKLVIKTLCMLDDEQGSVLGVIRDNQSGQVVHTCCKTAVE